MNIMFQVGSWHYSKGGTDTFVKTFSYWLASRGHKVIVLAHRLKGENCSDENIKLGKGIIKVRYTPAHRKRRFNPLVYAVRLKITSYYALKLALSEKIDIVIVGEPELIAFLPLKFTRTKIVLRGGALMYETLSKEVLKEGGENLYSKLFIKLIKIYNRLTLKIPDAVVPVNKSEYHFLYEHKNKKALIKTISHGVNTNIFKPKKHKNNKLKVGYVGRLAPIKYPEIALKLFKKAVGKNGEFLWIGNIDYSYNKGFFKDIVKKIEVKASWKSHVENEKIPNELNKMDIFLSVEQQKNVGRSTLEAASCGVPVVALNKGKEEYGFFSMEKEKVLKELKKLSSNKKYREEKGKEAREIVLKKYSENTKYQDYLDLFAKFKKW